MFIINCDRDQSYCKVEDADVIFNKDEPPKKGDNVFFYYNKNKEVGKIIMRSENEDQVEEFFKKLVKTTHAQKRKISTGSDDDESEVIGKKRLRKINPKYASGSFENMESFSEKKDKKKKEKKDDRKKKAEKILQENIDKELSRQRDIEKKKTSHKVDIKVAKTESKKQSGKILKDKTLLNNSSGSTSVSRADLFKDKEVTSDTSITESNSSLTLSNNDSQYSDPPDDPLATSELESDQSGNNKPVEIPPNVDKPAVEPPVTKETAVTREADPDLFGKDYPDDKMIRLVGETYCKSRDYDLAISASTQASHLVRRLITGVFKPSGYLKSTFTGQVPRAHKVKDPKEIKPLNITAKNAIIEFALKVAQEKNWKNKKGVATTKEELQHVMTQRLGELKRSAELNKKKNDSIEPSL